MTTSPSMQPGAEQTEDRPTLDVYDRDPAGFADDWITQPAPTDMYDALCRFFGPDPRRMSVAGLDAIRRGWRPRVIQLPNHYAGWAGGE